MREYRKRLAALGLAFCMVLGLAACGGDTEGGDTQKRTGTVYVPSFVSVEAESVEYINQGCADSQYIYFSADARGEEHEETSTWVDENGEEHEETYTYYDYKTSLFRVPLEGGAAVELENYEQLAAPEEAENSYSGINNIRAGEDGTLWVTEYLNWWYYDLPENFNPETDDQWNYEVNGESTVLRQLDSTGKELSRTELDGLGEKAGLEYTSSMAFDNDGNIFVNSDTKLAVLDKDQNLLFTLEGENLWGQMVLLGDGTVGLSSSYYDEEKETSGYRMRTVDIANRDWGPTYELSRNAYNVFPGGGDFLFYYQNNDSIYGFKAGASEGEKIFSWIDSDINSSAVQFFTFLADGRIAALTREWGNGAERPTYEAAILTPTDASTLPEKVTLTMATMGLDYSVRNRIIEFNKTSDRYRIEVRDYSEYDTGEDTSAGLTKMNTEILAGRVPDILDASNYNMPISQYASKGLLEDLWPYIEKDEEIGGREGVMENVFKAAEQDGKLYQIFGKFDIRTVEGAQRIVGDRMSWTLADLQAALAAMPEECTIFEQTTTRSGMLSGIMASNIDSFVDWSTGNCYFDSDTFKSLLSFCATFPEEFNYDEIDWDNWEDEDRRIQSGKQMLKTIYLDTFVGLQADKGIFGGDVSYVGYPMEDGSVGSSFQPMGSSFAMSATGKNKEGAWSFIRQVLLPMSEEDFESLWDFPMNRSDFEKYKAKAMTVEYSEDENGQPVLDENGEPIKISKRSYWISEDNIIEVYAATQEEVDQIMDLYNAITTIWRYDQSIYDIVEEAAGPYFSGDRSLDDTASRIQSSVKLYIGEQR